MIRPFPTSSGLRSPLLLERFLLIRTATRIITGDEAGSGYCLALYGTAYRRALRASRTRTRTRTVSKHDGTEA